jgi:hypothetical protein
MPEVLDEISSTSNSQIAGIHCDTLARCRQSLTWK